WCLGSSKPPLVGKLRQQARRLVPPSRECRKSSEFCRASIPCSTCGPAQFSGRGDDLV
ncbi:hypothetical protein PC116_g31750, partial [Phytophthora cactorum]